MCDGSGTAGKDVLQGGMSVPSRINSSWQTITQRVFMSVYRFRKRDRGWCNSILLPSVLCFLFPQLDMFKKAALFIASASHSGGVKLGMGTECVWGTVGGGVYMSVWRKEDWPMGCANGPWSGPEDSMTEGRALQQMMVEMRGGACGPEGQGIGGGSSCHRCGNSQGIGQKGSSQSFGEILREGQGGLSQEKECKMWRVQRNQHEGERKGEINHSNYGTFNKYH